MSTEENVQVVKDFLAAVGSGDRQAVFALSDENIEWTIPGQGWPLAGVWRRHAGLANLFLTASDKVETTLMEPREYIAQGDRVCVAGFARGKIKATNRTWEDHWIFVTSVRNGKLTSIQEYIDTQALARATESPLRPTGPS